MSRSCRRPASTPICAALARHDAVLIATDHDAIDYRLIAENARLILDTRNVFGRMGLTGNHIVKG